MANANFFRGRLIVGVFLLLGMLASCTESSFQDVVDDSRATKIRGRIRLSDDASPDGVYIWLEGTNISTHTDRNGEFEVTLPAASQGLPNMANGAYDLYYYLANYKFGTARVALRNGQFLYGQGDISVNGELIDARVMRKLLTINTVVDPSQVALSFRGAINVHATLKAVLDSVTVVFPKVVGGLLGAIVLKNLSSGEVFVDVPDVGARTKAVEKVGPEARTWSQVVLLTRTELPVGQYEVIPYFFIEQENLPAALLVSLGVDVDEVNAAFAKIPAKRQGGRLVVTE